MLRIIPLALIAAFTLTGCVDRGTADEKLAKGCIAGAKYFIADGFDVKEIKSKKFQDAAGLGKGHREVIITALESDGWHEGEEVYQCVFYEEFGPFNMRHDASIYQIRAYGETYGKEGDQILGDLDSWINLTNAIESGMNR